MTEVVDARSASIKRKVHQDIEQGTQEWFNARCGVITASVVKEFLTPKFEPSRSEARKKLVYRLASERLFSTVDFSPESFSMRRGHEDEIEAKILYIQQFNPVSEVGFMSAQVDGVTLGYSPDGLVGEDGLVECKSRASHLQMKTLSSGSVPAEFMAQIQTGLLVSGREWLDFISFPALGGGKMMIRRVYPDPEQMKEIVQEAIVLEAEIQNVINKYKNNLRDQNLKFVDVPRRAVEENWS